MNIRSKAAWGCLAATLALGVAACGDDEEEPEGGGASTEESSGGKELTVYSSLPLQGASRPQSEDVINGIKLALKQKGGKCGDYPIKYTSLDDATAAAGQWEAGATSDNARKAAQDENAVAYIGEFNSGASAISIPITNDGNLLQVSPSNTAFGLTKGGTGAEPGEPDKYYPSGTRNYGRVVPIDNIQGAALAQYMKDEGVTNVYILDDAEVYGKGVAKNTQTAAEELGIKIAGNDSWDGGAANYRALADKIKATGADAVFTGGIIDNNAPQLYKDLNSAMPDAKLFGPDGVATVDFTKEIPEEVQAQTYLTAPTLSPDELPPAGQQFYKDYEAEYGEPQDEIDPYAVYGYEAMAVVCDAIAQGGEDRQAVIDAFFATKGRESPLGTYDIDPDGDTTLSDYGGYKAEGGKLVFNKVIKAATS